jgi:branched-chain amino acid transport system permease protein
VDQVAIQFLNGLSSASSLFLVASGLSIIFGVTRVVNFAHGSFYMLGAYLAYTFVERLGPSPLGFWGGLLLAAAAVGLVGALVEVLLLRRIYRAPELFQLLATFGVALVVEDLVLLAWGPEELLGPRAPGLRGAVPVGRGAFPEYNLFLVGLDLAVLGGLWLLFRRTRWGTLVRAATEDRETVAALGVNEAWLFTGVFALGSALAGLGGALTLPREPVHNAMDLQIIAEAFVVVVIGGMGSLPGAYLAAVIIGELHAFGILIFPEITLVLVFLVMAAVLVVRPWGLLGRPEMLGRPAGPALERPLAPPTRADLAARVAVLAALAAAPLLLPAYYVGVLSEILIFALFATSLHLLMGPGGLASFGHAAYFGLGAYGAALAVRHAGLSMGAAIGVGLLAAGAGALLFGWFCVRLSGVYLAMLTLAFAQITYAIVFQWDGVTGGSNGIIGVWPSPWAGGAPGFFYLALALCAAGVLFLRRVVHAPFGYALRAGRDSTLRAEAIGIGVRRQQWLAFGLAGLAAGLAGALYAFFKGSVFPDAVSIGTSIDGLVMVLLGGVRTVAGPAVGAAAYKALQILVTEQTDYWRLVVGAAIVLLVLAFPQGLVGVLSGRRA